jgi:hypothetical protein
MGGSVNVDMKMSVLYKVAKFLNSQSPVSFSTRPMVHPNSYFPLLYDKQQKLKKEQDTQRTQMLSFDAAEGSGLLGCDAVLLGE